MADVGSIEVELTAKTGRFVRNMSQAQAKMQAVADAMKPIAVAAAATSVAILGVGLAALKVASGFESGMARVKAVSQATDEEFSALEASAKELGATTEFSARQAAEGMGFLAMAGLDASRIIKAMPSVLQLATAGNIELGEAANITTNIVTGMGMSLEDLAGANDVLVSAMTGSNVNLQMLGESFKFVGPVAKSAGISFNEVTAALGLMGNAGIQGSMAGTSLRMALVRLIKPPKEASEAMNRLGISVKDSAGKLLPLTTIMQRLEKSGAKTADMMSIFGIRAGPAMSALLSQGSAALKKFNVRLSESGGIAKRIQEAQLKTLAGRMKILSSAVEGLAIAIGEILTPAAKLLVGALTDVVSFFNQLSPAAKTVAVVLAGVVAVVAGLFAGLTAIAVVLPTLQVGFAALGPMMAIMVLPALKIVAVVGLIAAGLLLVTSLVGMFSRAWDQDFNGMATKTKGFTSDLQTWFKTALNWLSKEWAGLLKNFARGWGNLIKMANKAFVKIQKIFGQITEEEFKVTIAAIEKIKPSKEFDNLKKDLRDGADFISDAAGELKDEMALGARAMFQGLKDGAGLLGGALSGALKDLGIVAEKIEGPELAARDLGVGPSAGVSAADGPTTLITKDVKLNLPSDAMAKPKKEISKATQAEVDRILKEAGNWNDALEAGAKTLASAMGDIGGIVENAVMSFQTGGVSGGLITLGTELLSRTKAMEVISGALNGVLDTAVQIFDTLIGGLGPLINVVTNMVNAILIGLLPVFRVLQPVFRALERVLALIAIVIVGFITAIGSLWNKMVGKLQKILKVIGKSLAGIGIMADQLEGLMFNADEMNGIMDSLKESAFGASQRLGEADPALESFTEAANAATESLTNVPTGFKIAAARFAAQDPLGPGGRVTTGGELTGGPSAPVQGQQTVLIEKIEINEVQSGEAMYQEFERITARKNFKNTGSTRGAGSGAGAAAARRFLVPAVG